MTALWLHVETGADLVREPDQYVGSPLYAVIPDHGLAVAAVLLLLAAIWWLRRRNRTVGRPLPTPLARLRDLDPPHAFLTVLVAITSLIHIGLAFGHEPSVLTAGFLVVGVVFGMLARRLIAGEVDRGPLVAALMASILAFVMAAIAGEAPDEVAIVTKLVEITALAIVLRPRRAGRLRRLAASSAVVVTTVLVGAGGWVGAFAAGDGGHHLGEVPAPGVLLPPGEDRPPTPEEQREADHLYESVAAAIARYEDPAVAAADGYQVDGMFGSDFHAANPRYQSDGVILDPARPETLVYAVAASGTPVLLGAMFEMEDIGEAGPAVGGPLTIWHAHDHVCFSLTPPALAGLTDPFGFCPVGSITVPITHEMLHVWVLPGVEDRFGDIDDAWLAEYLAVR